MGEGSGRLTAKRLNEFEKIEHRTSNQPSLKLRRARRLTSNIEVEWDQEYPISNKEYPMTRSRPDIGCHIVEGERSYGTDGAKIQ
jgi:hypothetical protein